MHMNHHGGHWGWRHGCGGGRRMGRTGNVAFDEHFARVLQDLEDEYRAFMEYRMEERRKRDAEIYEAFRTAREAGRPGDAPPNP